MLVMFTSTAVFGLNAEGKERIESQNRVETIFGSFKNSGAQSNGNHQIKGFMYLITLGRTRPRDQPGWTPWELALLFTNFPTGLV